MSKVSDHRSDCGTLIATEDIFISILSLLNGRIELNYFLVSKKWCLLWTIIHGWNCKWQSESLRVCLSTSERVSEAVEWMRDNKLLTVLWLQWIESETMRWNWIRSSCEKPPDIKREWVKMRNEWTNCEMIGRCLKMQLSEWTLRV